MIPTHTLAFGNTDKVVMYTHGKITPIFRTLYANAEYGDMTRTRPAGDRRRGPGARDGPSDLRVPWDLRAFDARARMHFGLPPRGAHQRGHAPIYRPRPDGVRESRPLDQPRVRRSWIQAGRHDQRFLRRPTARVLRGQKSVPRRRLPRQARIQPRRLVRKETRERAAGARLPHELAHGHSPREAADPPDRSEGSRGPDRAVPRARRETLGRRGSGGDRRRPYRQSPRGRLGFLVRIDAEPHEVETAARQLRGGGEDPHRLCGSD